MKLLDYHRAFLANTVNLNPTRLDLLESRVESIYAALANDVTLGPSVGDYIKQGSWAHRTIIRPVRDDDEFDADILLVLEEEPAWADDKKKYITETLAALEQSPYRGKVEKHTRCVRVIYKDDCHVDVVPYIERGDGSGVIVNSKDGTFEDSNPAGFTDWMQERDDLTNGNLRRIIRLLKYLRDFKGTFSIPSAVLTTLLGERVFAFDAAARYSDLPTALRTLLSDLDDWLQMFAQMPTIADPSCPGVTFSHRWDQARYANFRNWIRTYSVWVDDAYGETNRDTSVEKWQRIFGVDFKAPPVSKAATTALVPVRAAGVAPYVRAPQEQMIEEQGYRWRITHTADLDGRVTRQSGFRHGSIRAIGSVGRGRSLLFSVTTDVPAPYEILWKVRNFGAEAQADSGLRGRIEHGDTQHTKRESTRYVGTHWIECYVIKNGEVRAWARHIVRIR